MSGRLDWDRAAAREARVERRVEARASKGKPSAQPATEAQRRLIASLASELGVPEPDCIATRSGAQAAIGQLKKRIQKREARSGLSERP